jgi:hypothetical protein
VEVDNGGILPRPALALRDRHVCYDAAQVGLVRKHVAAAQELHCTEDVVTLSLVVLQLVPICFDLVKCASAAPDAHVAVENIFAS